MSPASYNYDESMSSLRYANRAKNIKNKPKINEDPKDAMLREFEEEIKRLKAQLDSEHHDGPVQIEEVEEEEEVEENSQKVKKSTVNQVDISKMQEMVQQEKQIILETKGIEEDERNKLLKDLEVRAKQLETEDNQKRELSLKLAQLEEKLLMGGVSVLDKEEEQRMQLSKKQSEIEEKKRQERDLVYQLKNHEEQNIQIEEEYNTLTEEAASKTRKLKKLWALAVSAKMEVKDLMNEQQRERENLLETVRDITKDLKLKMFIISQYVPTEYIRLLEGFAEYDDMIDGYRIKYMQVAGNNVKMEQEEEWKSREDQFQSYEVGPVLVKKKAKVERVKGATKREVAAPRARGLVVNLKRYL